MTLPDDMYMGEQQHRAATTVRNILHCAEELDAIMCEGGLMAVRVEEPRIIEALMKLHNLLYYVLNHQEAA